MKKPILLAGCALAFSVMASVSHAGGPIEKACLRSDRAAATPSLCGCIQDAADATLRGADQRRAAKFFTDPDQANTVWLSKSERDDEFWERYKNFGATAEATCG